MLTKNLNTTFKYTKGEIKLALTKNNKWEFEQDTKNPKDIMASKTFTFGERYGIIKRDDELRSYININGKAWYLLTLTENTMPVLSSSNKVESNYIELREIVNYKYSIAW